MINVLMCTYNGEKYIREQIDSILNQTYKDLCLYIRDDGSTDGTLDIIAEYERENPGRVVVMNPLTHLGYPDCFWDILERCPKADYYAFSDQDDVWDENKVARAVEMLGGADKPRLYIHDYDNCDGGLGLISHHRLDSTSVLTDRGILFYTYASGFCMAINNAMRDKLLSMDLIGKAMYHDELCMWLAHFHGEVLHDESVLTKYRRHEATVTEYGNGVMTLISNWLRREIIGPEFGYKCERIRTFLMMDDELPLDVKKEWYLLSGGMMSIGRYFKRLFYPHRLRPSVGGEVALRLMFLMGRN